MDLIDGKVDSWLLTSGESRGLYIINIVYLLLYCVMDGVTLISFLGKQDEDKYLDITIIMIGLVIKQ